MEITRLLAVPSALLPSPTRTAVGHRGHRRARVQRGSRAGGVDPSPPRVPRRALPPHLDHHDRRQREHRRDLGHRLPAGERPPRGARPPPRPEGPGPGAAHGVDGELVAGRRVHGRRPVDRPRRAAAARRPAGVGPQRRGDRHPAGSAAPAWPAGPSARSISRTYNLMLRTSLRSGFSDAQCGFKALRADVARALLPVVEDQGWFFDTELLVLAERNGLRIHEVPGRLDRRPGSARSTSSAPPRADLLGVGRMLRRFARGEGVGRPALDRRRRGALRRRGGRAAGPVRVDRRRVSTLCSASSSRAQRSARVGRRRRGGARRVLDRQHRRQPAAHLRAPRPRRPRRHRGDGLLLAALPIAHDPVGRRRSPRPCRRRPGSRSSPSPTAPSALVRFGFMRGWVFR